MRYQVMHKTDAKLEAGAPPDPKILEGMGKLIGESQKSGVFLDGAGLHPSRARSRLRFRAGDLQQTHGPYAGQDELLAGFAMVRVQTREEAVGWARRIAEVTGDIDIELGPVVEAWDLGMVPKPQGPVPLRFLLLHKADALTEAGTPPPPERALAMGKLIEEMKQKGVLLSAASLAPSSQATRLQFRAGKHTAATDGPFAESKELVAGFSIIEAPTREAAIAWAIHYGGVLGDAEVDVRPVG